jgi:HSP20 family protein
MEEQMAEGETKVPVANQRSSGTTPAASLMQAWRPFDILRRDVDRLFDDFTLNPFRLPLRRPAFDLEPFWSADSWVAQPAMDLVERDNAFELSAEMPGLDENNIEVNVANGVLTVKGHKEEDKAEKKASISGSDASARSSARCACPRPWTQSRSRPPSKTASSK